jgi:hypothetical protein
MPAPDRVRDPFALDQQNGMDGIVSVDDAEMYRMNLPAFGSVEMQIWSDNALVIQQPRHWWEIAPAMGLKFQDGGEKQFILETIRIFAQGIDAIRELPYQFINSKKSPLVGFNAYSPTIWTRTVRSRART